MQPIVPEQPVSITPFADEEYEEQCLVGSFWTASRLLVIASLFLVGTFVFAYFYLRALDAHGNWFVKGDGPPGVIGTMVGVCVLAAAGIHYVGARRLQLGALRDWQVAAGTGMLLAAIACGLQVWQLTRLPFSPASSAFTSVFVAWMPVYIVYIMGQFFWLEILLAQSIRRPQSVLVETDEGVLIVSRFGANVEGYVLYTELMVVTAVLIWVLFYVL